MRDTLTVPSPATQQPRTWGSKPDGSLVFPWKGCWIIFENWGDITAVVGDDAEFIEEHGAPATDERAEDFVTTPPSDLWRAIQDEYREWVADLEGDYS